MHISFDKIKVAGPDSIRVYVAATEVQSLSVKVLEHSILKHAGAEVQLMPLYLADIEIPVPKEKNNRARTPFSFQRFLIPELAGYQGRAIYLDSDMQVLGDIRELWSYDMQGNGLLSAQSADVLDRRPQYSVMLLDCAKLRWDIKAIIEQLNRGDISYRDLMYEMKIVENQVANIPAVWNSLEKYEPGKTRLIHYTDMDTQPWIYADNPLGAIWVKDLIEAVADGVISLEAIRQQVKYGWIRPSLTYQVETGQIEAHLLPDKIRALDKNFHAPYLYLGGSLIARAIRKCRAFAKPLRTMHQADS